MGNSYDPTALLTRPLDDIKPPVRMPVGSYVAMSPDYEFSKTKPRDKDKAPTDVCQIKVVLVEAYPDVDQDQLAESLDGKDIKEVEMRPLDFFLTDKAGFMLKEFLTDHCQIEGCSNMAEQLEVLKGEGKQFGVLLEERPNEKNPDRPYINIARTFALPES